MATATMVRQYVNRMFVNSVDTDTVVVAKRTGCKNTDGSQWCEAITLCVARLV